MPKNPRVAIVHEYLTRPGGAERVAAVLADLFPKAPVFTLLHDEEKMAGLIDPARVISSRFQKWPKFLRRPQLLLTKFPAAVEAWDFSDFDVVISSSSAFAHGIVTPLETRHVCYCHSPARFLWDYHARYLRERGIRGLKKMAALALTKNLREWDAAASNRVDRWVANSAAVATRIQKYYRQPAEVVYPSVELSKIKMSGHHENYFVIVSQLTSYKKIELAISVFNKLRRRLVIVGDGPQRKFLESIAGPTIEFHGWTSDEAKAEILKNARGFIFPGEDDFGIAPVEAMAAGKPVLAFAAGGALETVVAGETGEFFDEPTAASLEDGLARLLTNEKKFQPAKLRAHAKKFERAVFEKKMKKIVREEWSKLQSQKNETEKN